jgi:nitrogen fixation protein NifX
VVALERRLKLVGAGVDKTEMQSAVKVAFATGDMKQVDQHFGAAESFAVYAVSTGRSTLTEVVQFRPLPAVGGVVGRGPILSGEGQGRALPDPVGHEENKLASKIDALDGCAAVYCRAVGASAINHLSAKGIRAVKVSPGAEIKDLLMILQEDLRTGPSAWLAGALTRRGQCDAKRFDEMEQEGWVE